MHIPIPKSHFYHRPSAHARNYGKMHGSHPNFEKLTIDFMLGRHYKCAFYTVICGIFITSLLSDLSLRVVTYDRTVVFVVLVLVGWLFRRLFRWLFLDFFLCCLFVCFFDCFFLYLCLFLCLFLGLISCLLLFVVGCGFVVVGCCLLVVCCVLFVAFVCLCVVVVVVVAAVDAVGVAVVAAGAFAAAAAPCVAGVVLLLLPCLSFSSSLSL